LYRSPQPPTPNFSHFWVILGGWSQILPTTKLFRHGFLQRKIPPYSGPIQWVRCGSGAKAPLLAARPESKIDPPKYLGNKSEIAHVISPPAPIILPVAFNVKRGNLRCNNGGGGGNFSKVKRLVRKCKGTRKRLFSRFFFFLQYPRGILETQEFVPRTDFTQKTSYAHVSLLMGCWNIQENLESNVNWVGDGRFCGGFPSFCILAPGDQTCQLWNMQEHWDEHS